MQRYLCILLITLVSIPFVYGEEAGARKLRQSHGRLYADSVIFFRFLPGRLMFYSPYGGNDRAIEEGYRLIDRHRDAIERGDAVVVVHGFCASFATEAANRRAARNRSNQVKSWFITHHGMKEDYYRTRNHTTAWDGRRDIVAIMGVEYLTLPPEEVPEPEPQADTLKQTKPEPLPLPADTLPSEPADTVTAVAVSPEPVPVAEEVAEAVEEPKSRKPIPLRLKSNLVYDVVGLPSLEVEYYFSAWGQQWSAAVEGNMAWWHNDGRHRYYQLATIQPEVRWWFKPMSARKGHYIGLMGGGGWYDLENKGKGYKGEGGLVGVSYGYMFPVGKWFSFEASLGLGYVHTEYEEYLPVDGHYVYQQTTRRNYFGPVKLRFALVWDIGYWMSNKKGGAR